MVNSEFLLTSLIVVVVPGTGVIYTVSTSLAMRWRAGLVAALGCTLGILPHLLATTLGLTIILQLSERAFQLLKWAGSLYLLYLAWSMWHDSGPITLDAATTQRRLLQIVLRGILINILNPKLTLFFFAFLPHFLRPETGSAMLQMVGLSAIFMGLTLVVFCLYGLLASGIRERFLSSARAMHILQRFFAMLFALLSVQLALTSR